MPVELGRPQRFWPSRPRRSQDSPGRRRGDQPGFQGRRRPEKLCGAGQKSFAAWLAQGQRIDLQRHAGLKITSRAGESERDFRIRVQDAQRQTRDAEVEDVRRKYAEKRARLEERVRRAEQGVAREQEQASQQRLQTAVSFGATVLSASWTEGSDASTLGRATTAARGLGRSAEEQDDVERAQENVDVARKELEQVDAQIEQDTKAIAARFEADAGRLRQCRSLRSGVRSPFSSSGSAGNLSDTSASDGVSSRRVARGGRLPPRLAGRDEAPDRAGRSRAAASRRRARPATARGVDQVCGDWRLRAWRRSAARSRGADGCLAAALSIHVRADARRQRLPSACRRRLREEVRGALSGVAAGRRVVSRGDR